MDCIVYGSFTESDMTEQLSFSLVKKLWISRVNGVISFGDILVSFAFSFSLSMGSDD